jgi:hypothetical protein
MSNETNILTQNISQESIDPSTFSYTDKNLGSGYHNKRFANYTATYSVNSFIGTIKLQASLEIYPGESSWFDITGTEVGGDSTMLGGVSLTPTDSTSIENISINFIGNFVWIRAAYNIQNGSIVEIRYNY